MTYSDTAHTDVRTLADLPFSLASRPGHPAQLRRCLSEGYQDVSNTEVLELCRALGLGLRALGIRPGDRVAIVSESRPEWSVSDFAILTAGAVTVPVYPTLSAAQTQVILADSGARVAIVSDAVQVAKIGSIASGLPLLESIIVIDPVERSQAAGPLPARSWAQTLEAGRAQLQADPAWTERFRTFVDTIQPSDVATIIYTSGTSGSPKGVVLTHHNILSNVLATKEAFDLTGHDVAFSFLPLSHTLERTALYRYLYDGVSVSFAESLQTVSRDLARVAPTIMTGVPRVFEKFNAAVLETVGRSSGLRRRLFAWAMKVGRTAVLARLEGRTLGPWVSAQLPIADWLVLRKVRARTGGRLEFVLSGSAPLARHTAEFCFTIGMPIYEGYGLTETAPVLTLNSPKAVRLGSVGRALPGVEIRIAEDGEILARGPNVMVGYYNRPEDTREALRDGWFHTGDVGTLSGDGYLTITDRKKDLIVTSGGKNIAPQPIEMRLKAHQVVQEAIIVGDRRNFPAALIVPDFAALEAILKKMGAPSGTREQLVQRADVVALYQALIDEINLDLAQFERIKRTALLPSDLTVEGGELTPTMKLRRKVVEQQWASTIEALYAREVTIRP
jgi:long-chain acyl-CoA synthetase